MEGPRLVFLYVILFSSLTLMSVIVFSVLSFIGETWKNAGQNRGQR